MIELTIPFAGFYESTYSLMIDNKIDDYNSNENNEIIDPDLTLDFAYIHNEVAKLYTKNIAELCTREFIFSQLKSPAEYNFSTDQIFITMPINQLIDLKTKVESSPGALAALRDYVRLQLSPKPGFAPYSHLNANYNLWPTNPKEWDPRLWGLLVGSFIHYVAELQDIEINDAFSFMEDAMVNGELENIIDSAVVNRAA